MSDAKHVVLIDGTWCRGDSWGPTRAAFEERGYTVHTPTLRHHELPLREGAMKVAPLSMRDYTDDLVALVDSLDSPPLLVGLSLGGLAGAAGGRAHPSCGRRRGLPGTCGKDPGEPQVAEFLTGQQPDAADDRVLAIVLFTDIVDSTRRAAEIGDRDWHALLDAHDAIVRVQLNRFRGREVNTSGDGFLATFDGPQRAIRCAMAIRDAVQTLGIQVRAGLHTGECEIRGDDIGGIAVHIGARVSALAGPHDVLVSSTLRDVVIGSGLEFEERGAHKLKGVPGEWRLFAVRLYVSR